jgi:DNA-binding transcriptional MerR regulator
VAETGLYTIGEVAAMLGVSTHTVRAWERRHEVVKPLRSDSGQRRYRSEEVELLREVKRAITLNGLSLRLAIRAANGSEAIETQVKAAGSASVARLPESDNESLWRGVVDVMPELVFVVDSTGRIVESNIATARLFGLTVQQIRGRPFVDFVEPFDRAKATLMYRPTSRTVEGWELNLSAPVGGPMYSFKSWAVRRGSDHLLVLVGSKMFGESGSAPAIAMDAGESSNGMGAGTYHRWLDRLLTDPRFQHATTSRRLSEVAMQHLVGLLPAVEFALAIAALPDSQREWSTTYSPAARKILQAEPDAAVAFGRVIRRVAARGVREAIQVKLRGRVHTFSAIPLSPKESLGVLAWSRPSDDPLTDDQRRAVDAFVAWVSVATEKLHVRSESARQESRFNDVVKATSVIRESSDPNTMGATFLKLLADLVHADSAAIGRIAGSDFVLEAVYSPGGSLTKRGDRFRLLRVFADALRTGQATRGTAYPRGLPEHFERAYGQIKHFLGVPVVLHGRTSHMISLARFADRPFSKTDADIVRALSATALLATQPPPE